MHHFFHVGGSIKERAINNPSSSIYRQHGFGNHTLTTIQGEVYNNYKDQFHQHSMSSFCVHISQKHKKADNLTAFFELSGFSSIKAAHRTLIKLTPDLFVLCLEEGTLFNLLCADRSCVLGSK